MVTRREYNYNFRIKPLYSIPPDVVKEYFQLMLVHDTLKYRFSDIDEPQWPDAMEVIHRVGNTMYFILDEYDSVVGEFMLENKTGKAMQIHFSSNPTIDSKQRLSAGRFASKHTITRRHPETHEHFLDALYGLTPLENRAACLYVLKVGYKKQGILPSGMIYMGKPTDCMISTFTREN